VVHVRSEQDSQPPANTAPTKNSETPNMLDIKNQKHGQGEKGRKKQDLVKGQVGQAEEVTTDRRSEPLSESGSFPFGWAHKNPHLCPSSKNTQED